MDLCASQLAGGEPPGVSARPAGVNLGGKAGVLGAFLHAPTGAGQTRGVYG